MTEQVQWKVVRNPAKDWMSWNAVLRIVLPVMAAVLLLAGWMEVLSGGWAGLENLLTSGLMTAVAVLLLAVLALVLCALLLRGRELLVCTLDSKGVHIERYLPDPTPLKLLLRLKSPSMMNELPQEGVRGLLLMDKLLVPWKLIARVQLWPEKSLVLLYSPSWWQRASLPCSPVNWQEVLGFIRMKIGKKKNVILPPSLRDNTPKKQTPKPVRANQHARPFEGMEQNPVEKPQDLQ